MKMKRGRRRKEEVEVREPRDGAAPASGLVRDRHPRPEERRV